MDDQQIGGGSGNTMGPSSAESADNSGPLEKRIVSKNWSVRANAYEELTKLSQNSEKKSKADHFKDHIGGWKEYLKDSNPGALEKALVCLNAFLDRIHPTLIGENQNVILNLIVEKCIGHAKPVIKDKGIECMLLMFEVSENFEESVDTLQQLCAHKNIKVMTCGTIAVAVLLENFGIKKVRIPDYAEQMLKNAQNTNPACKNAAYDYYKAAYKWIGDAILPQIEDKLKKLQVDEIKKMFEEVKAKNDKTMRYVRSEKAKAEEAKLNAQIEASMAEEVKEVDPLEFAPEKDVLKDFGAEWTEAAEGIKKWDEKVAKINELTKACTNVKIKAGNTECLSGFLKKEIGNSNINISVTAIEAASALANGMGKNFQVAGKQLCTPVFLKFKEKKTNVLDAATKYGDAMIKVCNLEELREEVIPLITNVAPGVKMGVLKYVEKAAVVTYIDVLKRVSDELLAAVSKAMDDKDGTVRDQALHCMGILKGRVPDEAEKHLKNVNPQKMAKIDEASKEIKPSKYDRPENWKPPKPKAAPKQQDAGGDDELMSFDAKPKRAPPKGIGQKPPSKKKAAESEDTPMEEEKPPAKKPAAKEAPKDDEAMTFDPPKAPAKKAPALSSAKPKPAAASSAGSGKPSAPVIQDEDVGTGCSKEEAIEKVAAFFSPGTVAKFEDAKWQVKVEAFTELQDEIKEKEAPADMIEAAAKFIKAQMKDFKESNINLQKSVVGFYAFIAKNCENVNKRTVFTAMAFFVDKIGDVKLSTAIKEMLMDISELVTPKFVGLQIIKHASTAKAPKNIQESCTIITQMIDEFGIGGCALKETIELGVIAAAHATPAVRQSAMKLFCEIYRHVGEVIKTFLTDIKDSTLKLIEAELGKTEQYKKGEHQKKRNFRGEAAEEASAAGKGGKKGAAEDDPLASLPREDISKKLNAKLMEQFKNKDWKIRKKACDDVEALLREAKMRIKDVGLNDLMDALKNGMKDPNKAVVKVNFNLLGLMADALGPEVRQYTKKCLVPMLNNISDKQTLVRQDVVSCMNKWKDNCGAPTVINQLGPVLEVENPEGRTESLKWITENKDAIKQSDYKSLCRPLVQCLTDKSKAIRESAEVLIELIMPLTGFPAFLNETNDMKPAVKQTIRPMLEKLKTRVGDAPAAAGGEEKKERSKSPNKEEAKPANSFAKAAQAKKEPEEVKKPATTAAAAKPAASSKQEAAEDEVTIKPSNKNKRAEHDRKVKWPLYEVKGDHIEKLQNTCYDIFGQKFHDLMWAKAQDFQKHIKCVEQLDQFINTQPDELIEVLDIVFKWCNVRLNESSNTKLVVSILDFYANLITFLHKSATELQDFEAHVLLGTLCDKVGINNKILMDKIRKLIKMCYDVHDVQQCYRLILEHGVKAKNQKSGAECLDEVAEYIQKNGIDHVTKKDFAVFLQMAESSDKALRENSLKVFANAYEILGEDIWRLLGKDINTKVKGLLEQRFKQVQKKTGNNLALSTNSFKDQMVGVNKSGTKNPLLLSGAAKNIDKRMSVMPTAGALKGLQKSLTKKEEMSSKSSENELATEMKKFAPFNDNETQPIVDVEMKNEESKPNLQDVFAGKAKLEPLKDIPSKEDDVAMVIDQKQSVSAIKEESKSVDLKLKCQGMDEDHHAIQDLLKEAEMNLDIDPAVRQEQKNILNHIQQLVEGDLLKRVDSLVALNEMISSSQGGEGASSTTNAAPENPLQQQALIRCCNQLINAFTHVMNDIFSYPVNDIPLRFTKYFITIVNKTCACKEIMREVNEKQVHQLAEQLLSRLLIDNLDKIGQNKEGELILKSLNSAMLRMLENCNHTYIFIVLFSLLVQFKDNPSMPKLPGLIIKCLLKLSKIMDKLIDKIDLARFLLAIHKYLCSIDHENKSQNDDLGIRIVKTLVNELVKLKKNQIWEFYEKAGIENDKQPDVHIKKWIQIIIRSLPEQAPANASAESHEQPQSQQNNADQKQAPQSRMYIEFEIKKIVQELRDPSKLEQAISKLDKFSKQNPTYNFQANLSKESDEFCKQIMTYLENYRNGNSLKSTNEDSLGGSSGLNKSNKMEAFKNKLNAVNQQQKLAQSTTDQMAMSIDKHSEFKNKMAELKKKQMGQSVIDNNTPKTNQNAQQQQQQQQSTFSALNSSLSQKWAAINANQRGKLGLGTFAGRPQTAQPGLAQTINPQHGNNLNDSQNKFQSKLQQNLANKLQNKTPGLQQPSQISASTAALNSHRDTTQTGISMNSFKTRLQGFQGGSQTIQNVQSDISQPTQSANSQDLQKKLAEMKARLQGINNNKK